MPGSSTLGAATTPYEYSRLRISEGGPTLGTTTEGGAMVSNLVVSIVVGLFVIADSPAHAACTCCDDGGAGILSFETGIGSGICGQMRNFRCEGGDPDFLKHACVDSGDCYLGPCIIPPGVCGQDPLVTCSQDSDCGGACAEQTTGGFPIDLTCGRLYTGGGLTSVRLPLVLPDRQQHFVKVEACPTRWRMDLGAATRTAVGEHHCTEGAEVQCRKRQSRRSVRGPR
jgi:hypothetical protein